jgi:hypothetical protein
MENNTKARFFMIIGCIVLAAILPGVVVGGFGLAGGLYICGYAITIIVAILWPKKQ